MKRITISSAEYQAISDWFESLEDTGGYDNEYHFNHRWGEGSLEKTANEFLELTDYGDNLTFEAEDDVVDRIEDLGGMADEAGFFLDSYTDEED